MKGVSSKLIKLMLSIRWWQWLPLLPICLHFYSAVAVSALPTLLPVALASPHVQIALEVLANKPQIRKGDVMKEAKARGLAATDNLFGKVSKELCKNNGSYWVLKTGADM